MRHSTHGIQIKMSDMAGTPVFAALGHVTSITPFSGSRGHITTAEHDMTGAFDKFGDVLVDEGQVVIEINWDPSDATHDATTGIEKAFRDGVERDFQLIFPPVADIQADFAAIVTRRAFNPYPANSGIGSMSVTLEISGSVVWT